MSVFTRVFHPEEEQPDGPVPTGPASSIPTSPATPIAPPEPSDAKATRLLREASTWLVGALAAVGAAVLGAGITFSNVGQLEWGADTPRLLVAGASAALAFAGVVGAVLCLYLLQRPVVATLIDLRKAEERRFSWIVKLAKEDRALAGGFDGISALLGRYDKLRKLVWDAEAYERTASETLERLRAGHDPPPSKKEIADAKSALVASTAAVAAEVDRTREEYERLQGAVETLLDWVRVSRQSRRTSTWAGLALSCFFIAALGTLTFAWAGNPPERGATGEVLGGGHVAALLTTTSGDLADKATPKLGLP